MPGSRVHAVTPDADQERELAVPWTTVAGAAVSSAVVWGYVTVTVTELTALPPRPEAIRMYVTVTAGDTAIDPVQGTPPMPPSRTQVSAPVVLHISVAVEPLRIEAGVAVRLAVGSGYVTVTSAEAVALPPGPVAVRL
jgi:hypothetical protein